MKKSVIAGFCMIVIAIVLLFYGSAKGWFYTWDDWTEDHPESLYLGLSDELLAEVLIEESGLSYIAQDTEAGVIHRKDVDRIFGETWHSDNYNKAEIEIPEVDAEETVEGENWFPVINNTAPLDEIAPTISYELMLDGYKISPYYPQNPEDYTAQALNENAFPIGFFRKVNDLCYYTACKVEGGGYIYYFFCANGNVDYKEAMADAGIELNYDKDGNLLVEETVHLFNSDLADISSMDLTKEVVWRGSIYATADTGTIDEFNSTMEKTYYSDNWFDKTPYILHKDVSSSFKPLSILQDIWANNSPTLESNSKEEDYTYLQKINQYGGVIQTQHMCSDGYVYLNHMVKTVDATGKEMDSVDGISPTETLQFSSTAGYGDRPIVFHHYGVGAIKEQMQEYNSYSIEILPQDNIHNLK